MADCYLEWGFGRVLIGWNEVVCMWSFYVSADVYICAEQIDLLDVET